MKNLATCAVPAIRSTLFGPSLLFAPPSVHNRENPHSFVVRGGVRSTDFGPAFELISEIDVTRQGTTQDNSGHFRTSCEQTGKPRVRFNRFDTSAGGEDTVAARTRVQLPAPCTSSGKQPRRPASATKSSRTKSNQALWMLIQTTTLFRCEC
jgi:hypothetical protein